MGVTVRQKVNGKGKPWSVFIHQNGIIRSKQVGDKRAAESVASALRRKLKAGELNTLTADTKAIPTFAAYAEHYLQSHAAVACKPTTIYSYRGMLKNHILPVWRSRKLDQIRRVDIKSLLIAKQQEGLSSKSVENIKALLSGIFSHAIEEEVLTTHPALRLGRFIRKDDRRKHIRPLTKDQASELLRICQAEYPNYSPMLLCAMRTGMRLGELLGLAWSDLEFNAHTIDVRRAYTKGGFTTPKSRRFRIVDMSDQLKTTLLAHRESLKARFNGKLPTHKAALSGGDRTLLQLVFPSETGGPHCGDNFRHRVWTKLIEKADIPRIRFHDLRHTFASLLLANGESLHYVKEQMGHASIQTTVDVYGHLVPGSNRNAVNRLDDDISPLRVVSGAAG